MADPWSYLVEGDEQPDLPTVKYVWNDAMYMLHDFLLLSQTLDHLCQ